MAEPSAAEMQAGLAGLVPPPPVSAAKPAPVVRWLTDKKRTATYDLLYPFELDGVEYRTILLKRLITADVAAFVDRMNEAPDGETLRYPLYYVGDSEISDDVWNALDDDDRFELQKLATDFLPARFRQAPASQPSA